MARNIRLFLPLAIVAQSCFADFSATASDRLYLKLIKTPGVEIDWFTYSAAYANSPDFIVLKSNNQLDTLCRATNVLDVNLQSDTISISFNGRPSLYTKEIIVAKEMYGYKVITDTVAAHFIDKQRKYFQLKDTII